MKLCCSHSNFKSLETMMKQHKKITAKKSLLFRLSGRFKKIGVPLRISIIYLQRETKGLLPCCKHQHGKIILFF